ncbi:MAG TPA: hypothetical protein VFX28_12285, partial [Methylomirabilota bacterium]|nr:hypothetical protein [Methylomirabilota bacterium]
MSEAEAGRTAAVPPPIDVEEQLRALARVTPGATPVISVYLDTRWSDEHARERVRVFLKTEARKAGAMAAGALDADLAWIAAQGDRLVAQELHPEAQGVAMFASGGRGLRETIALGVRTEDRFVVADTPRLRPLLEALAQVPPAVVLFVDGESARLVTLTAHGVGEVATLESGDVVGHHRRGGWAMLLQSRYQRHIQVHRARHFEAVARALAELVLSQGIRAVVLAGEPRNVAVFRHQLPPAATGRVAGAIAGARYEPASVLAERALDLLRHTAVSAAAATVDTVLVDAAAGGRAVAGVDATVEAVNRGTVDRLYFLRSFEEAGQVCPGCGALQKPVGACRWCGKTGIPTDLPEAMLQRVVAAGGEV